MKKKVDPDGLQLILDDPNFNSDAKVVLLNLLLEGGRINHEILRAKGRKFFMPMVNASNTKNL